MYKGLKEDLNKLFTIHFATINTLYYKAIFQVPKTFTIHFATINTSIAMSSYSTYQDLQYTLLLLIL